MKSNRFFEQYGQLRADAINEIVKLTQYFAKHVKNPSGKTTIVIGNVDEYYELPYILRIEEYSYSKWHVIAVSYVNEYSDVLLNCFDPEDGSKKDIRLNEIELYEAMEVLKHVEDFHELAFPIFNH
jgi:hypothetical protein